MRRISEIAKTFNFLKSPILMKSRRNGGNRSRHTLNVQTLWTGREASTEEGWKKKNKREKVTKAMLSHVGSRIQCILFNTLILKCNHQQLVT